MQKRVSTFQAQGPGYTIIELAQKLHMLNHNNQTKNKSSGSKQFYVSAFKKNQKYLMANFSGNAHFPALH